VPIELRVVRAGSLVKGANKPVQEKLRRKKNNIITKRAIFFMAYTTSYYVNVLKSGKKKNLIYLANIYDFDRFNSIQHIHHTPFTFKKDSQPSINSSNLKL
jgi:hypothetical protein